MRSTKILLGQGVGMLTSDIAILLLLSRVVGPEAKLVSHKERTRRAVLDYALCFGFPALIMATHIVYQPFRTGITTATGCLLIVVNTWAAWVCFLIWQPLLSFVGCMLAGGAAHHSVSFTH